MPMPVPPEMLASVKRRIERGTPRQQAVQMVPPHMRHSIEAILDDPDYVPPAPKPQPLDKTGALATLLVVNGTLTLDDAANAIHVAPEKLVAEAEAWAVAAAG